MAAVVAEIFAVQRVAQGRWLVWAPDDDPCTPAVHPVAVLEGLSPISGRKFSLSSFAASCWYPSDLTRR
jgi:hypothetical protein